jgi:hypothetical protein
MGTLPARAAADRREQVITDRSGKARWGDGVTGLLAVALTAVTLPVLAARATGRNRPFPRLAALAPPAAVAAAAGMVQSHRWHSGGPMLVAENPSEWSMLLAGDTEVGGVEISATPPTSAFTSAWCELSPPERRASDQ